MKRSSIRAGSAAVLCLCTAWIVYVTQTTAWASDSGNPGGEKKVIIVDGKKVIVWSQADTGAHDKSSDLTPEQRAILEKTGLQGDDAKMSPIDGAPRGGVPGACCDIFNGSCTIRDQTSCEAVGGFFRGDNTVCTPTPCPQPLDCSMDVPVTSFTQLPPDAQFDPFASFLSDVDAGQLVQQGFNSSSDITRIRWWGVEVNGSANCTRTNTNFNITFYADASDTGSGFLTSPTPEVIASFPNLTVTREPAGNYVFNGQQGSYNGQLLWQYTAVLPQRVATISGWVSVQATADGGPCNFRWMCHSFGPGHLFQNGQQVVDPNNEIQDVSLCLGGSSDPVTGACCDDSVTGGSCANNVDMFSCNDFNGGNHRFRVDQTCASLTPPCGAITGSCCVGATCTVVTAVVCNSQGGSFIAFEDCTPNICVGACCFGDGTCSEVLESDCLGQGGQFFGNGSLCENTACPGTGRCCFNNGASCEIRTEGACDAIGGSRWDEGLTCATPCPVPPSNDQCESAIPIMCGETITVDNTVATSDPSDPQFACAAGGPQAGFNTIWFTFTPTASSATVRTCNGFAPADDSILAVYEGTCGAFTQIACDDDGCTGTLGLLSTLCVSNLVVGNTYYIEVASWDAASIGPYALEVVCPGETCASTGSCCLPTGGCVIVSEPVCQGQGGSYNGDTTVCSDLSACCTGTNSCIMTTSQCCASAGGAFLPNFNCGDGAGNPTTYTANPNIAITDAAPAGVTSTINVPDSFIVGDVDVQLSITHTWVGDMCISLEHLGTTVDMVQRMGIEGACVAGGPPFGCAENNLTNTVIDDEGTGGELETTCIAGGNFTSPPNFTPLNPLSAFNGLSASGDWTLTVVDNAAGDVGTLNSWALILDEVGFNPCDANPGACCVSEGIGDCQILTVINCAAAGGRFQGGNTTCTGDICVPRGACCNTVNGGCEQLTQEACQALPNTNFLGDFTSCGQCPVILGACCMPDTSCQANTQFNPCTAMGGSFLPGVSCGDAAGNPTSYSSSPALAIPDNPAPAVSDSQNVSDSFVIGDVNLFIDITHTFIGDLEIDLIHDGVTVRVMDDNCASSDNMMITFDDSAPPIVCGAAGLPTNGTFQPLNPLAPFNGHNASGQWTLMIRDDAGIDTGTLNTWTLIIDGVGVNPCDSTPGACCVSEGVGDCQVITAIDCAAVSGRFQGGGTACTGDICVPRGACCNTVNGSCQQLTQEACQALPNSNFLGDFTPCGQCPVVLGSCCLPDLSCLANTQFNPCTTQGGVFTPGGNCDAVGACCLGDSTCQIATQACCLNASGAYLGDGTNCGDAAGNPTTYSASPALAIPDNVPAGVTNAINVADSFTVGDVDIQLDVTHTFVGDLCVDIIHQGTTVSIIQRIGSTGACAGAAVGCLEDNLVNIVIDDEGTGGAIDAQCPAGGNLTSPPSYTPNNPLSAFDGSNSSGDWTISISDNAGIDVGTLNTWAVIIDRVGINPCDTDPGACCFSEGTGDCQLLDAVGCANAGGRFQGGGTACSGNVCVPRGACCNTLNGSCQQLTQEECQATQNGNFLGDFTGCGACPIVTGACCLPNNSCQANTQFNPCTALGGVFIPSVGCGDAAGNPTSYSSSPALAIPDNPAPAVSDSQNVNDSFVIGDVNLFIDITHTFIGDLEIDLIHDGVTVRVMDDNCASSDNMMITFDDSAPPIVCAAAGLPTNGTFHPLNALAPFNGHNASGQWTLMIRDDAGVDIGTLNTWTLIIDGVGVNPCDQTPGACCLGETDGSCQLQTSADCSTLGGRYQGPNSTCTPGICIIRGACCDTIAGTCTFGTPAECTGPNRVYQGNFTTCGTVVCTPATGACCTGTGACQNGRTLAQCTTSGGNWEGPNSTCETSTGACCMGSDDCLITSNACCAGMGGSYAGTGTNCGTASGSPTGYPTTFTPAVAIPDNNATGVSRTITIPDSILIADLDISLNITHQVVGQLIVRITHNSVTRTIIDRIGVPSISTSGCLQSNLSVRLDDEAANPIELACAGGLGTNFPVSPPNLRPNETLSAFDNMDAAGTWTITVIDSAVGATNGLINSITFHIDHYANGACDATPQCATCPGDMNGDNVLDGRDVDGMTDCLVGVSGNCACGDMNSDSSVTMADLPLFVSAILQGGTCGGAPICGTCSGDANGDGVLNGSDCRPFMQCFMNPGTPCPCSDMDASGTVDMNDMADFVNELLTHTGACP